MIEQAQANYEFALRDFERARQRAVMQQLLARFRGENAKLLPFGEIQRQLHPTGETIAHGTQEIALDKIVGSVARYEDFTRSFLPKRRADKERWASLRAAMDDMVGIPPIEVYQVGDAYFVQDGNHRVSIARGLGSETITAYVTEIKTRVPFSAADDPNELICKASYADFLLQTNLDKTRPEADLMMTFCGHYHTLLDQIDTSRAAHLVDQEQEDVRQDWERAAADWFDQSYMPIVRVIRELGVLHHFPNRTEADLYVLLSERRDELELRLGWHVDMETGVSDLIVSQPESPSFLKRFRKMLIGATESDPEPGLWRQQQMARGRYHHLFKHILVGLDGTEENWRTFENYLKYNFDDDHFLGLHVVPDQDSVDSDKVRQMQARFIEAIKKAGMKGEFAVEIDANPVEVINRRAAWVDLVLVRGNRSPSGQPLSTLSAELKLLVQKCPRPIMVTPDGSTSDFGRAILAYDGSPKADEALFIATYLTSRWRKSLTVVTVKTSYTSEKAMRRAKRYISKHGLMDVKYVLKEGPIADSVLETAAEANSNLLLMGGFSFRLLPNMTLGSLAEGILREFPHPVWICR